MITNTKKSYDPTAIWVSRKVYYQVLIDGRTYGFCTNYVNASAIAKRLAKEYGAEEIKKDIYVHKDSSGQHIISLDLIKRMKMPALKDDDD